MAAKDELTTGISDRERECSCNVLLQEDMIQMCNANRGKKKIRIMQRATIN